MKRVASEIVAALFHALPIYLVIVVLSESIELRWPPESNEWWIYPLLVTAELAIAMLALTVRPQATPAR